MSAKCHVWTAPGWQVKTSRCVAGRCSRAVRMTAGHNALRGSGPGQKPAFDETGGPEISELQLPLVRRSIGK